MRSSFIRASFLLTLLTLLISGPSVFGQAIPSDTTAQTGPTVQPPTPTVRAPAQTVTAPATASTGGGDPIQFSARDSLVISGTGDARTGRLFGEATVNAQGVELEAYKIAIDFGRNELLAEGLRVDTGLVGRPAFQRGDDRFLGRQLAYNLDSGQGRVVGARTAIDEGYVYGGLTKQLGDSVLYVKDAMYTTCDHEDDPHYHIRAGKMKIVNGEWIYSGPMHLRILNVPLPIWLPFGFLPAKQGRRSGPLPPSFGEDSRGFFMRDFGWYFAMNDYTDFQIRLGVWTGGSFEVAPQFRYAKRYHYDGQVAVDWIRNIQGLSDDPDFVRVDTWSLRARHDQTMGRSASLVSNIDFSTSNYLRTASRDYIDNVRQTIGSDVQFSQRWKGRSLNVYANQRQVLTTGVVQMSLPRVTFNQQTFRPFQRGRSTGSTGFLDAISVSYRGRLENEYSFERDTTLAGSEDINWWDALWDPDKYKAATGEDSRFDFAVEHQIPIAANFQINGIPGIARDFRMNLGARFTYDEDWYLESIVRDLDPETGDEVVSKDDGFLAIRQFQTNVNANTEIYGTFNSRLGPFRAFRHVLRPSAGMTFRPDFSSDTWGYYDSYIDEDGEEIRYAKAPGISRGEQATLSLGLGNVLQAKRATADSLQSQRVGVSQLLTLDLGINHNFAADSLNWSDLNLSSRTRLFDRLDFNLNAAFSPYKTNDDGDRIDEFNSSLLRLTNLGFTMRTSISGGRGGGSPRPYSGIGDRFGQTNVGTPEEQLFAAGQTPFTSDLQNTPTGYADFSIPWSIAADLTYNLSRRGNTSNKRAIMNIGFDFNLTPKWKIHGRSGYDFIGTEFSTTNITILRDFHDWEMGFNWTPFGQFASFQFDLRLKTGPLREMLRLKVPQSDIPDRFGQLTGQ